MATLATQNKFYVFTATRAAGKIAAGDDAPGPTIARAAVVGMGTMGTGIVQALITAGIPVVAYDENSAALESPARPRSVRRWPAGWPRASWPPHAAEEIEQRLTLAADRRQIAAADLVVESVFEDVGVKRSAIAGVEEVCPAETIIASNTSTISLDVLAEGMRHRNGCWECTSSIRPNACRWWR